MTQKELRDMTFALSRKPLIEYYADDVNIPQERWEALAYYCGARQKLLDLAVDYRRLLLSLADGRIKLEVDG